MGLNPYEHPEAAMLAARGMVPDRRGGGVPASPAYPPPHFARSGAGFALAPMSPVPMSPPGAVTPGQMPAHFGMPPSPSPIPNQMAMAGYVDARMQGAHAQWPAADLIDDKSLPTNSKPSRAPKLAPLDVFPDGPRDRSDNRQEEEVKFG